MYHIINMIIMTAFELYNCLKNDIYVSIPILADYFGKEN